MTFDDVGDPDGTPVVYLHGGGDSRLSRHPDDSIAAALGVRLLASIAVAPRPAGARCGAWAEEAAAARRRRPIRGRRLVGRRPARARARRGRARSA